MVFNNIATSIIKRPAWQHPDGGNLLTITAFGPPHFTLGADPIVFSRRKSAGLLLYLAVTRRPHSREALATLLWGELSQQRAMANLRKVLSELHECVGEAVLITRDAIAINPTYPIRLDVAAFEAAVERGLAAADAALLSRAVQDYPNDFLAGWHLPTADGFDEWALLYREHLRETLIAALEALVGIYSERGEYRLAFMSARRVVMLDPWREEGHRQLMWLLARSGERAAAVAQYGVCRRILAEQLGVDPMPETTALYEQLRAGTDGGCRAPRWGREQVCAPVRDRAHYGPVTVGT